MSYIGAEPTTATFPFDQFSGNGTTTAFTLTYAPASTTSIIVSISVVVQNPNTYSVIGTTLNFSPAPPTGTNNIAVLYLGLPVIGVSSPGNTAFRSAQDFTAVIGQTTFTPTGSYVPGFIDVFRNGARLGNADFTATNGTTVILNNACVAGDLVTLVYFTLSSIVNALPLTGGTVTGSTAFSSTVTMSGAATFTGGAQINSLGVGTTASGTAGEIRATGNITAYYSDDRLKDRLGLIENALDKLMTLDGFYYQANETAQQLGYAVKREVGVSAQQVQAVLPEVVTAAPVDAKYFAVQYTGLVPLLIQAVKELKVEVDKLKDSGVQQ